MAWEKPKTDWQPGDGIKATDLNRIERNIDHLSKPDIFTIGTVAKPSGNVGADSVYIIDCLPFVATSSNTLDRVAYLCLRQANRIINLSGTQRYTLVVGMINRNTQGSAEIRPGINVQKSNVSIFTEDIVQDDFFSTEKKAIIAPRGVVLVGISASIGSLELPGVVRASATFSIVNHPYA